MAKTNKGLTTFVTVNIYMYHASNFSTISLMFGALLLTAVLFGALVFTVYGSDVAPALEGRNDIDLLDVCAKISSEISAQSEVFYPGTF